MKKFITLVFFFSLLHFSFAQFIRDKPGESFSSRADRSFKPVHSKVFTTACSGSINTKEYLPDWKSRVISYEKEHYLPPAVQAEIDRKTALKEAKSKYPSSVDAEPSIPGLAPKIGINMQGNVFDGFTPPDNCIAVSNNGTIVSVANSNLEYYDVQGNFIYSKSFGDLFGSDPELTGTIYDPVIMYDSQSDRFFFTVLHGSESQISKVIVCFSKSNDISDGWWYYKLPGNVLSNSCWFDYPKIGISNNEVYITGNLFTDNDSFSQALLFQISKAAGYEGEELTWQYWYGISNNPFTLVPASFGQQGTVGPGIYLVSTVENAGSDKIYLFDLTDDIGNDPEINVFSSDDNFSLAGDALQKGSVVKLNNNDARALNAFYLDGTIHFIFHSDRKDGYAGLNYHRLNVSDGSLWNSVYGMDEYDYSYPSIASFSNDPSDKSVMISFLRSNSSIFPENRVVYCDNSGNWSSSTLVKEGETYVDVYQSNQKTRWGDYSGIAKKYNSPEPEVWLSGCFGHYSLNEHSLDTWIAQVKSLEIGINDKQDQKIIHNINPNPVTDIFKIDFELKKDENIRIWISDLSGKEVKLLFSDKVREGRHLFSFNKGMLSKGNYILNIGSSSGNISHEKIIIL